MHSHVEGNMPDGFSPLSDQSIALFTLPFMKESNTLFKSYDLFFQTLREGKYHDFTSTLEAWLENCTI